MNLKKKKKNIYKDWKGEIRLCNWMVQKDPLIWYFSFMNVICAFVFKRIRMVLTHNNT